MESVAIVGKGIAGLMSAFYLLKEKPSTKITIYFIKDLCASQCALGIFSNKAVLDPKDPFFALKFEGVLLLWDFILELENLTKKKISKNQLPLEEIFFSEDDFTRARKRLFQRQFSANAPFCVLEKSFSKEYFSKEFESKFYFLVCKYFKAYYLDILEFLNVLEMYLKSIGCQFAEEKVVSYMEENCQIVLNFKEYSQRFSKVIFTTGGYSEGICLWNKDNSYDLSLTYGSTFRFKAKESLKPAAFQIQDKYYLFYSDYLIWGSTSFKDSFKEVDILKDLVKTFSEKLKILENSVLVLSGARLQTFEGTPLFGFLKESKKVFLFTGLYRNGFTLAPSLAPQVPKYIFKA